MARHTSFALLPLALFLCADILASQRRATGGVSTSQSASRSTPTRSYTPAPTPTRSYTPTRTPTRSYTPAHSAPRVQNPPRRSTPTRTPTRSYTPTRTPTRSYTPTRTPTRSYTPTRTPTRSYTPTRGSTPSSTPRRVSTPPSSTRAPYRTPTSGSGGNTSRYVQPSDPPVRIRYTTRPRTTPTGTRTSLRDMYRRVPTTGPNRVADQLPNVRTNVTRRLSDRYTVDTRRTAGTPGVRGNQPRAVPPGSNSPRTAQPRTGQPRTGQPRASQPRSGQPGAAEPRTVQPRSGQPRSSRPGTSSNSPRSIGISPRGGGGTIDGPRRGNPRSGGTGNRGGRRGQLGNRPRRAGRGHASNRYHYGGHHYRNHYRYGSLLGLCFLGHLGWNHWHYYAYDPFYCNYYVGHGYHHYHWSYHYCHPLNYVDWWYPAAYYLPSYIYVNSHGDYSPYPSTVVIASDEPEPEPGPAVVKSADKPSPETLVKRHVTLGDFYFKDGRYSEASESYLRALAYAPEDASIHFILADALFALGDYHYAAFIIGKALRLDPAMAFAEADKRTFYTDKKEFEKHMATILTYVREKPFDPAGHLVLGYNYKFSDQKEKAIESFREVLKLDPKHESATLFLEALLPPKPATDEAGKKDATPDPAGAKTVEPADKGAAKPKKLIR